MPSLKEIKGRITSVKGTLKITSAMKLVASAKLKKAQSAIGNMLPYQHRLNNILVDLLGNETDTTGIYTSGRKVKKVAIVCFSSNTSLCGGFNANAIRKTKDIIDSYIEQGIKPKNITVFSIGRKIAQAMAKLGYPSPIDYHGAADKPNYEVAAKIAEQLMQGFVSEQYDKVQLVYNHFVSTASQPTQTEVFLPLSFDTVVSHTDEDDKYRLEKHDLNTDFILEPGREELIKILLPKVLKMKIFTVMLDTNAAEHAARTVSMQIATDNGNELLEDLTLEYNKGRQQKITSEILDLVGGSLDK